MYPFNVEVSYVTSSQNHNVNMTDAGEVHNLMFGKADDEWKWFPIMQIRATNNGLQDLNLDRMLGASLSWTLLHFNSFFIFPLFHPNILR